MITLLIAMLFANNAAASSENAPACGKLSDYYTQRIYDGIIGYPCYKVTGINDKMIAIMGRSDDYRSNDNFHHYTIAESSEYMMVIDEHENVVERIKMATTINGKRKTEFKILECFGDNGMIYLAVRDIDWIGLKYELSDVVMGIRNGEMAFTRAIGGENVKNIYKGENGFLFVCEENGKIILKK